MWLSPLLTGLVRVLVGATPHWIGCTPVPTQRIYFANHSSHLDTLALWSALPPALRMKTRPVAAADYWGQDAVRRYVALQGLNVILIDRTNTNRHFNPLQPLNEALEQGDSLIIFPEGTRKAQPLPGPFMPGLYHLAVRHPDVEFVPVYLENLHRCMPKGSLFPVPLICTVRFGAPVAPMPGERKAAFLERARNAVVELA